VGNALFRPTFSLFFTKTRKKFLKRARKREKSKKNRKKRTKNHENEKKNTDFTHFRELQLPKMGKIIQQWRIIRQAPKMMPFSPSTTGEWNVAWNISSQKFYRCS
jgi:hypothetical protein